MTVKLKPVVVEDAAAVAEAGAAWTAELINGAVSERGACYLALAGGETPRGCYQRLAAEPYQRSVRWGHVHVYWSDERQVPLDDLASNYGMAKTALLDRLAIPPGNVHPLVGDPIGALNQVPTGPGGCPRFDLIHLGLGEDGHTASLFPGDAALGEQRAWIRAVRAVKPPPDRLTMTFPVLNAARAVLFLVQGDGKRRALAGVMAGDPSLPASRVRPGEGEVRFIVDRAAWPV
ncbi:MAG TPA: 6-phosphogluconolactonase [Candidatus Dormibacteraeota bacterium]|nr:6-phosphogluconolactonase [Candidatus Dormibacteraeota bacterium]